MNLSLLTRICEAQLLKNCYSLHIERKLYPYYWYSNWMH